MHTLYQSDWCVVQGKGSQMALVTDEAELLKPTESLDSTRFKAGDRYRIIYIPLGMQGSYTSATESQLVEVTSYQPVLVEDILQRATVVGTYNDPVWVNLDPFFGGGYLNFDFRFYSTETTIKHGIHLIQDSTVNKKIYVRFCHDANGDGTDKTASALASFPIRGLKNPNHADSLIVVMKTLTKFHTVRFALRDTI
jgi:hypothetical protein